MGINRLERVMARLRKRNQGNDKPTNMELQRAIMLECGTDPQTLRNNRKALMTLEWIKVYNRKRIRITGRDIADSI